MCTFGHRFPTQAPRPATGSTPRSRRRQSIRWAPTTEPGNRDPGRARGRYAENTGRDTSGMVFCYSMPCSRRPSLPADLLPLPPRPDQARTLRGLPGSGENHDRASLRGRVGEVLRSKWGADEREIHVLSYFSLDADLAGEMREWPEFVSGSGYASRFDVSQHRRKVAVRFVADADGEPMHVAVSTPVAGALFDRVSDASFTHCRATATT